MDKASPQLSVNGLDGVQHPQPHARARRFWSPAIGVLLLLFCVPAALYSNNIVSSFLNHYASLTSRSSSFEQRAQDILIHHPLIDGHNDLMILIRYFYKNQIYGSDFTNAFENGGLLGQVDLPRLSKGKVGGSFWSAFVPCQQNTSDFSDEAYAPVVRATLEQLDLFHRLSAVYPHYFTPPSTAAAARRSFKQGKLISPTAIEGLHQIGNSLSTLRLYHALGVRYATLTWNCHNIYADSAVFTNASGVSLAAKPLWGGLSEKGRQLVLEMNRMGMIVDLSHVSQDTMRDVLGDRTTTSPAQGSDAWNGSLAPPIFSHSSAYAICPHPRNVPDDLLQLVRSRNSLVMVNFLPDFISCVASNSSTGLPDPYPANATLHQVVKHIRYIGDLIGYDHVGLGSDYDGIDDVPKGLEDVSKFPDLVAELLRQGLDEETVIKIMGGNLLRVWEDVDRVSQSLQKMMPPAEDRFDNPWVA